MDPATVMAMVGMANSVSQLFNKGNGAAKVQAMQMQMLFLISQQLGVLQKGIEIIIRDLIEIKKLINEIPSKTVTDLYRSDCMGYISLFQERMKGYINERDTNGIEASNKIYQTRVANEILYPLTAVRAKLLNYSEIANIPIICSVLHTEIQAMILTDQPFSLIQTTLESYLNWFNSVISTIPTRIDDERISIKNLMPSIPALSRNTTCVVKQSKLSRNRNSRTYFIKYGTFKHIDVTYKILPLIQNDFELKSVQPMIEKGLIRAEDLPIKLNQELIKEVDFGGMGSGNFEEEKSYSSAPTLVANNAVDDFLAKNYRCPPDLKNEQAALEVSNKLEISGYSILSLGALLLAGMEAIEGIKMYQNEVTTH